MGNILKSPLNTAHSLPLLSPKPGLHLHNPIRTQRVHLLLWNSHSIPSNDSETGDGPYLGPPPHTFTSKASLPTIHISPAPLAANSLIPALPALLLPVQQPWTGTLGIFSLTLLPLHSLNSCPLYPTKSRLYWGAEGGEEFSFHPDDLLFKYLLIFTQSRQGLLWTVKNCLDTVRHRTWK